MIFKVLTLKKPNTAPHRGNFYFKEFNFEWFKPYYLLESFKKEKTNNQ